MAARLRAHHQDSVRAKIQASNLITLLQKNAIGKVKPELSQGRITSARILLDKSVSNAPTQISGTVDGTLKIIHEMK
jgi:hypothetical protein